MKRYARSIAAGLILAACTGVVLAQGWKPTRNVEIIVGSAAGGGADLTARQLQKLMREKLGLDFASSVVNKTGGGSSLSYVYLNQHPGDAHYRSEERRVGKECRSRWSPYH